MAIANFVNNCFKIQQEIFGNSTWKHVYRFGFDESVTIFAFAFDLKSCHQQVSTCLVESLLK